MKQLTIVVGSARRGRVADKILEHIQTATADRTDVTLNIVDLRELNLPFFDEDQSPSAPGFTPSNESAQRWTETIDNTDGVLFITPEYNHQLSAIMKNAVDWIYKEWAGKPATAVAYGWGGGALALEQLEALLKKVEAKYTGAPTQLYFMQNIDTDGAALTPEENSVAINATIDTLIA